MFRNFIFLPLLSALSFSVTHAAEPRGTILVVLSAADHLVLKNGKEFRTGLYLNELMIPAKRLIDAGFRLEFATPEGRTPHLDPSSDDPKYFGGSIREYRLHKSLLEKTQILNSAHSPVISLSEARKKNANAYQGLFVPGGHAPMVDLGTNGDLGMILKAFHSRKTPTALICHGPVALLSAMPTSKTDKWIYAGYKMTVFSIEEDKLAEAKKLGGLVPFYPAEALRIAGGIVLAGKAWESHVVVDRELITGQNPNSDVEFSTQFLAALNH